jgi:hypothetical protein
VHSTVAGHAAAAVLGEAPKSQNQGRASTS